MKNGIQNFSAHTMESHLKAFNEPLLYGKERETKDIFFNIIKRLIFPFKPVKLGYKFIYILTISLLLNFLTYLVFKC